MDEVKSFPQRLFKAILSQDKFEDMRKESLSWMQQCSNCKYEVSVWSQGGIRWKAAGNPRVFRNCVNCHQNNWHVIYKKENP